MSASHSHANREDVADLVEVHAVAAVVRALRAEADLGIREDLRDLLRDFAHAVVLFVAADVENFVVDRIRGRLDGAKDGFGNIQSVNDRSPRCAIAAPS